MNSNFHWELLHNFFQKPSFKNHLSFLSFFNYNFHHLRNYKILILLWWINTEFPKILSEPREVDCEGGRRSWEISKQNWGGENEKEESEYKPRRGRGVAAAEARTGLMHWHQSGLPVQLLHTRGCARIRIREAKGFAARREEVCETTPTETPYITFFRV